MKKIMIVLLAAVVALCSCHKSDRPIITGTVVSQGGFSPTTFIVVIDNPNTNIHPFLCSSAPLPTATYVNCSNGIYITNLPATLTTAGQKIVFSNYKDMGINPLFSSTYVCHDVQVFDARKAL